MGIGYSTSDDRAREAAERRPIASSSTPRSSAPRASCSIAGGEDLSLLEVNEAAEIVRQASTDETNIIFGATIDERLQGQMGSPSSRRGSAGTPQHADVHHEPEPEERLEPETFLAS